MRQLFAGADAGVYALPAELLAARDAIDNIEAMRRAVVLPDVETAGRRHRAEVIAAARDGQTVAPSIDELLELERQVPGVYRLQGLLTEAREQASRELIELLHDSAEDVLVESLRPVFEMAVEDLRKHGPRCRDVSGESELAQASKAVRDSWLAVQAAVGRVRAVRAAASELRRLYGLAPQHDTGDVFASMRNKDKIWPGHAASFSTPPWPVDVDARTLLLAQLDLGAELWLPTPAEQDARFLEVYGDGIRQMKIARQQAAAVGAMYDATSNSPDVTSDEQGRNTPAGRLKAQMIASVTPPGDAA